MTRPQQNRAHIGVPRALVPFAGRWETREYTTSDLPRVDWRRLVLSIATAPHTLRHKCDETAISAPHISPRQIC